MNVGYKITIILLLILLTGAISFFLTPLVLCEEIEIAVESTYFIVEKGWSWDLETGLHSWGY